MKQLKRLSLTELSDRELKDRQMKQLKGGDNVYCVEKCGYITPPYESTAAKWDHLFDPI